MRRGVSIVEMGNRRDFRSDFGRLPRLGRGAERDVRHRGKIYHRVVVVVVIIIIGCKLANHRRADRFDGVSAHGSGNRRGYLRAVESLERVARVHLARAHPRRAVGVAPVVVKRCEAATVHVRDVIRDDVERRTRGERVFVQLGRHARERDVRFETTSIYVRRFSRRGAV